MIEHAQSSRTTMSRAARKPFSENGTLGLVARSVTHELRQPLSLIAGYAELLANRSCGQTEVTAFVDEIRQAATRLAASLEVLERPFDLRIHSYGPEAERQLLDLRPVGSRR